MHSFANECVGLNNVEPPTIDSLKVSIRQGLWGCSNEIINILGTLYFPGIKDAIDLESRNINSEIQQLRKVLDKFQPLNHISPAFKWAQSPDDILLNLKFSHKIDAPATLNVEISNITISDDGLLLYATDGRKHFKLDLLFYDAVIGNASTWSLASVGRMDLQIRKANSPKRWDRLLKDTKKMQSMHFWWDMHDKHVKDLDALTNDIGAVAVVADNTTTVADTAPHDLPSSLNETDLIVKKPVKVLDPASEKKKTLKQQMNDLDDQARMLKKAIDSKAKEGKSGIDKEFSEKKKKLKDLFDTATQIVSGSISVEL